MPYAIPRGRPKGWYGYPVHVSMSERPPESTNKNAMFQYRAPSANSGLKFIDDEDNLSVPRQIDGGYTGIEYTIRLDDKIGENWSHYIPIEIDRQENISFYSYDLTASGKEIVIYASISSKINEDIGKFTFHYNGVRDDYTTNIMQPGSGVIKNPPH